MNLQINLRDVETLQVWSEVHNVALLGVNLFVPISEFFFAVQEKVIAHHQGLGQRVVVLDVLLVK